MVDPLVFVLLYVLFDIVCVPWYLVVVLDCVLLFKLLCVFVLSS